VPDAKLRNQRIDRSGLNSCSTTRVSQRRSLNVIISVGNQFDPRNHLISRGIDLEELPAGLNVDEDVFGDGIVLRVSDVAP
jgi:hypothetical protein